MRYISVCSGIEAASVAWHPLGWEAVAFSEIEPFPSAVLAHHYPAVPNLGDMTKYKEWSLERFDLLVGGTPCQSFSVAGLRRGLDDPRGNLMLVYLAILAAHRPRWMVWENVPGVLSSNGGRDFGTFLGALAELGYGWAYRVLDAEHFGVPQRRYRVFVVGYSGKLGRRADTPTLQDADRFSLVSASVLFERHSLSGNPPPCREAGERVAPSVTVGPPFSRTGNERVETDAIVPTLTKSYYKGPAFNGQDDGIVPFDTTQITSKGNYSHPKPGDPCHPLAKGQHAPAIAHALRADGFDASEDGTGRGTPLVVGAVTANGDAHSGYKDERGLVAETLRGHPRPGSNSIGAVAVQEAQTGVREYDTAGSLRANGPGHDPVGTRVRLGSSVRRLTPRECERLQGFPDDYTLIPYRGKPSADGPRYKALGNSMAVPVMRWIGERIAAVESV